MYLLKVFLISHWLIILKKDCFLKTSDFYSGSDVENQKKKWIVLIFLKHYFTKVKK